MSYGDQFPHGMPIMVVRDPSVRGYRNRPRRFVGAMTTILTVASLGYLGLQNRNWINRQCIGAGVGVCADGMLAQKLRSAPNELQTSVEAKRGGKIITGLGSYSLGADAVRPSKDNTKIYIFPEFKYDPDTLRQVFGSTYKMSANDTPKTLSNDIVAKLGFTDHINFLVGSNSISSDTEAMKQACVRDMSAIVEQAKNHAGWLLGESTEVSPAELIGAENTYATRPFTPKGPANDPSVVNIYVAAVLPTTDGKGTIAQVTCGMEESSAASTAKPTASATSTG